MEREIRDLLRENQEAMNIWLLGRRSPVIDAILANAYNADDAASVEANDGDDIDVAEAAMNPPGNTPFDLVELEEMGFWAEVEDDNRRAIQVANDSVSNA